MRESSRTWQEIYAGCESGEIAMVPGIGIFMASPAEVVPAALISHVTIMHSLPESVSLSQLNLILNQLAQHQFWLITLRIGYAR
jgi:hypothetical protein